MSSRIPDAVVVGNREKTTKTIENPMQLLNRGIRVLWLDCGISNRIKRPETKANIAIQAVTVRL